MFVQFNSLNQFANQYKKHSVYDFIASCFLGICLVFYLEQGTYLDASYYLFNILNKETFNFEHNRFLQFIPQIPAVIAVKLGLSIKSVAFCFGLGYHLFYFTIYLIITRVFKQQKLAMLYLSCLILGAHETYFDLVSETKQALGMAVLLMGYLLFKNKVKSFSDWQIIAVIVLMGTFSHPVFSLYILIIVVGFAAFSNNFYWQPIAVYALSFVIKSLFLTQSSYEDEQFAQLLKFSTFGSSYFHSYFFGNLFKYYKLILLIGVSIAMYYFRTKSIKFLTYCGFVLFLYAIIALQNAAGESHFMIQKTMFPLVLGILFPILFIDLNAPNFSIIRFIWPLVLLMGIFTINTTAEKYNSRYQKIAESLVQLSNQGQKWIVEDQQIDHSTLLGTWALAYETAIISKIELSKTILILPKQWFNQKDENKFIHAFGPAQNHGDLNAKYFKLEPSSIYKPLPETFKLD